MRFFLIIFSIAFLPLSLSAQPRGTWKKSLVCSNCIPQDLAFADTNIGFIVTGNPLNLSTVFYSAQTTIDGGNSFSTPQNNVVKSSGRFASAFCPAANHFIYCNGDFRISSDSGSTWQELSPTYYLTPIPESNEDFSPANVITPVQLGIDTTILVYLNEGTSEYYSYSISTDDDSIFVTLGDTVCKLTQSDTTASANYGGCATRDLSEQFAILQEQGSNWKFYLAHSKDTGASWQHVFPIDTSGSKLFYTQIFVGAGNGHYFILGGRIDSVGGYLAKTDDYLESKDTGRTWNEVSNVSEGRVFFLANPDTNILWAVVGREPEEEASYELPIGNFADSLFYSSDGGATWSKDGSTFQGDTILAMRWLTKNNGYVITFRDSNTFLYHYSEQELNLVAGGDPREQLTPYPNPVQDFLNLPTGTGNVTFLDVLGQSRTCARSGDKVDVSSLPSGVYFLSDGVSRAKFVKE
jgi:Secretion system C-terminal sorting domain